MLLASGRALPSLQKILASHALIHTAEGEAIVETFLWSTPFNGFNVPLRIQPDLGFRVLIQLVEFVL
jgi:hypothetical protein